MYIVLFTFNGRSITDGFASLHNLELRARVVVEGFISGLHKSPHRGFSVEFNDYRNYYRGDDMRHVDWKLYARSDKFYIKQYEDETNVRCYVVLDSSASMGYASGAMSKLEYGRTLASALAWASARASGRSLPARWSRRAR